jgi:putative PIN family toxin of toxin-antitoxin system
MQATGTRRKRVVLDTNVLISAYRFGGKAEAILALAQAEEFLVLTSEPLRNELEGVLAHKFFMTPEMIIEACAPLLEVSQSIHPRKRLNVCSDEPDNRVLECAVEGKADFIVAGDRHLLNLPPIEGLAILSPDAFLTRIRAVGSAS